MSSKKLTDLPSLESVMLKLGAFPVVTTEAMLSETLTLMSHMSIGTAVVADNEHRALGVFTDGDLRRKLFSQQEPLGSLMAEYIGNLMTRNFVSCSLSDSILNVVELMKRKRIWDMPVVDNQGYLKGMLHLHPLTEALFKELNK